MRISDWRSDGCSSDLAGCAPGEPRAAAGAPGGLPRRVRLQLARGSGDFDGGRDRLRRLCGADGATRTVLGHPAAPIGRASSRLRGCPYVSFSVVALLLQKPKHRITKTTANTIK